MTSDKSKANDQKPLLPLFLIFNFCFFIFDFVLLRVVRIFRHIRAQRRSSGLLATAFCRIVGTHPRPRCAADHRCRVAFGCLLLTAFCLLLTLSSCGYHVAGRRDRLPPDVKTIAVPAFVNETSRFRIEQKLAAAVTREFIERTRFRITPDPSQADALLKGTVKDARAGAVAFDLKTGRATTLQIQVLADVELVDLHTKKVLFSNPNYVFREEYQVSQSTSELFEEDEPALDRLSRDLARTLVTEILENF